MDKSKSMKLYKYEKLKLDKLAEQKKEITCLSDLYDFMKNEKKICRSYIRAVKIQDIARDYVETKILLKSANDLLESIKGRTHYNL